MEPENFIQQSAESALQHRTSRRGLLRGAGRGAAGLALGGSVLSALFLTSCFPGRSNARTGKPHAVLAAKRDGFREWEPMAYGDAPLAGVEWVKLQGDPATVFAQVGNPDRYAGDTYRTSQLCALTPVSTSFGPVVEVTADWPGSYAIATKFRHRETGEVVEELHYVDVRPRISLFDVRAIALGFETDGENLDVASDVLDYVRDLRANLVSIQAMIRMPSTTGTELSLLGPSDDYLLEVVEMAQSKSLSVLLKIHLFLQEGQYTGTIQPADWPAWFANYGALVQHFAHLAQDGGVEYLAIGNELGSSHEHGDLWEALIAGVRPIFGGQLTYADNTLNYWPYNTFPAVHLLDSYGFNYWTPGSGWATTADPQATPEEMYQHMTLVRDSSALAERLGAFDKPLLITEGAGMNPFDGLNSEPPLSTSKGIVDEQEAVDYLEACYRFWNQGLGSPSAIYWTTDLTAQPLPYRRNDPRGRPIEDAIKLWYA